MRTIIDIPEDQVRTLAEIAKRENVSRAELVRRVLGDYLAQRRAESGDSAFGLWKGRGEDGVSYQDRLRGEWNR